MLLVTLGSPVLMGTWWGLVRTALVVVAAITDHCKSLIAFGSGRPTHIN